MQTQLDCQGRPEDLGLLVDFAGTRLDGNAHGKSNHRLPISGHAGGAQGLLAAIPSFPPLPSIVRSLHYNLDLATFPRQSESSDGTPCLTCRALPKPSYKSDVI